MPVIPPLCLQLKETRTRKSEPFQGPRILIITVEAMRAMIFIVVIGIEWTVGRLSCNSCGVVMWSSRKGRNGSGGEFVTREAWLRKVRATMRALLHLGQGQGWRGSGILNWYDRLNGRSTLINSKMNTVTNYMISQIQTASGQLGTAELR